MAEPLVSIVITNYRYERFVGQAIDSALEQTYPNTEVIVVDDGSDDGSRDVIAAYGERIVPVLKDNGGQGSAFNAGFAASRGEIVMFLDADDVLLPHAAARVVSAWQPRLAKAQFRLECCDAELRSLGWTKPRRSSKLPAGDLSATVLRHGGYVSPPTSGNAFGRACLAEILPMPEAPFRVCADAYLIMLSPLFGEVASIDEILGAYRIHDANNWSPRAIDGARVAKMVDLDLRKEAHLVERAARLGRTVASRPMACNPSHLAARLSSLRLNGAAHPVPSDSRAWLLGQGLRSIWRFSEASLLHRARLTAWFVAVSLSPASVASPLIARLLTPHRTG
jgi:glycosyltransferase involved in cell wall biosynthesis